MESRKNNFTDKMTINMYYNRTRTWLINIEVFKEFIKTKNKNLSEMIV